jgi:predicted pyridoxine 5'-phosphate oxidase superfamily flavin-nucleotide-binding protein
MVKLGKDSSDCNGRCCREEDFSSSSSSRIDDDSFCYTADEITAALVEGTFKIRMKNRMQVCMDNTEIMRLILLEGEDKMTNGMKKKLMKAMDAIEKTVSNTSQHYSSRSN